MNRHLRKTFLSLFLTTAMLFSVTFAATDAVAAGKPSLAKKVMMKAGKQKKLSIKSNGYTIKKVTVKSSSTKTVTVKATKKQVTIKAKKAGKATVTTKIRAKKAGKTKTFTCKTKVTVSQKQSPTPKPTASPSDSPSEEPENKMLPIRVEFGIKGSNEASNNDQHILKMDLTDNVQSLSDNMSISYDIYIPKEVWSEEKARLTLGENIVLSTPEQRTEWMGNIKVQNNEITIVKDNNEFKAVYFDGEKMVPADDFAVLSTSGEYVKVEVKKVLEKEGQKTDQTPLSLSGVTANVNTELFIRTDNVEINSNLYVDDISLYAGETLLDKRTFENDTNEYWVEIANRLKVKELSPVAFHKNKVEKNPSLPLKNILNASDEEFIPRTSTKAITNTISEASLKDALQMPTVSYDHLPKWHGTHIGGGGLSWLGMTMTESQLMYYTEEQVKTIASEGFNEIGASIDTRIIFSKKRDEWIGYTFNGNSDNVNILALENLDKLVEWGIKYKVHIAINVLNSPGNYGGLLPKSRNKAMYLDGTPEQQIFLDFWDLIAKRYKNVPSNAVSFGLLPEPCWTGKEELAEEVSKEQYVDLMKKAIHIVRNANEDRLIVVGMLDSAMEPVYGLEDEKIVQCFHLYEPRVVGQPPEDESIKPVYPENGKEILEEHFKKFSEFSKETGTPIFMEEFGASRWVDADQHAKWLEDILSLADQYEVPWSHFTFQSNRYSYVVDSDFYKCPGGTYEPISNGMYVCKEMKEVFKKHMQ